MPFCQHCVQWCLVLKPHESLLGTPKRALATAGGSWGCSAESFSRGASAPWDLGAVVQRLPAHTVAPTQSRPVEAATAKRRGPHQPPSLAGHLAHRFWEEKSVDLFGKPASDGCSDSTVEDREGAADAQCPKWTEKQAALWLSLCPKRNL